VDNAYTYLWEFQVEADLEAEFARHDGPTGTWAQLFRQSPDYIETLLLMDDTVPVRYLTVDRWRGKNGYLAFKAAFAVQYAQLDKECERLTARECSLGMFCELPPNNSFKPNPLGGLA
jgi:hypothetical protein